MVREGTAYLSLAIPVCEYSPGAAARKKLQHLLAASVAAHTVCAGDFHAYPRAEHCCPGMISP
jgi:hypothetical protein